MKINKNNGMPTKIADAQEKPMKLADLAKALAGDGADLERIVDLTRRLIKSRNHLGMIIAGEASWPSRTIWIDELMALQDAAELIVRKLGDGRMLTVLEADASQRSADGGLWLLDLRERVGRLAELARTRHDAVPAGQGKHIFVPSTGLAPKELCAVAIVVAWRSVHGRDDDQPRHTAPDMHKACAALWHAAGGTEVRWGNSQTGWIQHIKVAKSEQARDARLRFDEFRISPARRLHLKHAQRKVFTAGANRS